jgi:hypothetical protein
MKGKQKYKILDFDGDENDVQLFTDALCKVKYSIFCNHFWFLKKLIENGIV